MRIGVFGGSFDPIHIAHLLLAETALEQLQLDVVRFIPAAQSPLKVLRPLAATDRREMVQLAICGNDRFELDSRELEREGRSYTIDTLQEIKKEQPDAQLFLLIGSDSLRDFLKWHRPADICKLARLAVAHRGGDPEPEFEVLSELLNQEEIDEHRACKVEMPIMDISSTTCEFELPKAGRFAIVFPQRSPLIFIQRIFTA